MSWFQRRVNTVPTPLSPPVAKLVLVLCLGNLALGLMGLFLYDGATRLFYVVAFTSGSIANLLWAIGSLQRDPERGDQLRAAMRPFAALMLVTLPVAAWLVHIGP